MSEAERRLWSYLRRSQMGVRVRRQHPIGHFIADFACPSIHLVIEVDGSQHIGSTYDRARDASMEAAHWTVLRVWAVDVIGDIEGTLDIIAGTIEDMT